MHFFKQRYEKLPIDGEEIVSLPAQNSKRSRTYGILVWVVFLGLVVSVFIGGANYLQSASRCPASNPSNALTTELRHCGSSPEEARRRGCRFDFLSFAWQVPECYDEELIDEFRAQGHWDFYRDAEGTQVVRGEVAARGEIDMLYVHWDFHVLHCKYMWTQMHRVLELGRAIDSHLKSYEHTKHCGMVLMEDGYVEGGQMMTQTPIVYPVCEIGRKWQVGLSSTQNA